METNDVEIRRDFLGNEICIGDEVVYSTSTTAEFRKGRIIGFTAKKVRVLDARYYDQYEKALGNEKTMGQWGSAKSDKHLVKVLYTDPEAFRKALFPV